MPVSPKTNIARKVDLTTEVTGVLPLLNSDPTLSQAVVDYYSPGTVGADGQAITLVKDGSNKLPFLRLKGGSGITVSVSGNSLLFTGSTVVGGSGDMLKSVYDTDNDGIVDEAAVADAVAWANITGIPSTFAPSAHNQAESTITGNAISGATGGLLGDLAALTPMTRLVNTANSLTGGGTLAADRTLALVGDTATPGNNQRYGTGGTGTRGWFADAYLAGGMAVSVYATNGHAGWVDVAVLANSVGTGAVTSGGLAANAVTTAAIANLAVTAAKLATGAAVSNIGYTPVNKAGDTMSGPLDITATGPSINTAAWQNGQLLIQTSGAGTGNPVLGFARVSTGDGTGGGVALYYTGNHNDFQLAYSDGTTASLLSTLSPIPGAHLIGPIDGGLLANGTVTAAALAPGTGVATGTITMWPGAVAPIGCVFCDGASYLRTALPALFALIGVTFGSVDSTHFNVPDFRGRTPVGAGLGTGLTNRVLAASFGEENHKQLLAEMATHGHTVTVPAHACSVTDPGHVHSLNVAAGGTPSFAVVALTVSTPGTTNTNSTTTGITVVDPSTVATVVSAGSSTPANVMQPSLVVNFVIKT